MAFDNISISLDCYLTSECTLVPALTLLPRPPRASLSLLHFSPLSPPFPRTHSSLSLKSPP